MRCLNQRKKGEPAAQAAPKDIHKIKNDETRLF